jgi:hypothetical protein
MGASRTVLAAVFLVCLAACSAGSTAQSQDLKALAAAQDQSAQSDLANTLMAAKIIYSGNASFSQADSSASGLATSDPTLCYVGASTPSVATAPKCESGQGDASISVAASDNTWSAARMSASGTCFWIKDDSSSGTKFGSGTPCTGVAAAGAASMAFPG